jgi:hypothetical protein
MANGIVGSQSKPPPPPPRQAAQPSDEPADFTKPDDPAFFAERARVRGLLEYQPKDSIARGELERVYDAMTAEFLRRARLAWSRPVNGFQETVAMADTIVRARLLAVEILLADPESLGNDALEADLYIARAAPRAEHVITGTASHAYHVRVTA